MGCHSMAECRQQRGLCLGKALVSHLSGSGGAGELTNQRGSQHSRPTTRKCSAIWSDDDDVSGQLKQSDDKVEESWCSMLLDLTKASGFMLPIIQTLLLVVSSQIVLIKDVHRQPFILYGGGRQLSTCVLVFVVQASLMLR